MGKFQRKIGKFPRQAVRGGLLPAPATITLFVLFAWTGQALSQVAAAQSPSNAATPTKPPPSKTAAPPTTSPAPPLANRPGQEAMPRPPAAGSAMSTPAGPELAERIVQRLDEIKQAFGRGDTGAKTQAAQTGLVELLDQLAASAERQEAAEQGQGGGAAASAATQPKPMPAPAPSLATDDEQKPDRNESQPPSSPSSEGPPGAWGKLPAQQREAFLQSLREKRFPARYQRILEQYYRGFRGSTP